MAISIWAGLTEFPIPSPSGVPNNYVIGTLNNQYTLINSAGFGGVTSVSNSDGSLTISPTTGVVEASINAANSNFWSATQYFYDSTLTNGVAISADSFVTNLFGLVTTGTVRRIATYDIALAKYDYADGNLQFSSSAFTFATAASGVINAYNATTWNGSAKFVTEDAIRDKIEAIYPTTLTAGSVVFAGASGVLAQDNANLFWDDTNNRLGIGTASPNEQVEITGNFRLPASTSSVGVIKSGTNRYIHNVGTENFFAGVGAGSLTTSGVGQNTGIGVRTMEAISTGSLNTAVGWLALGQISTGTQNTAFGWRAGYSNNGSYNSWFGLQAGDGPNGGGNNMGFGIYALSSINGGTDNAGIGYAAGGSNGTGSSNIYIGSLAGFGTTSADGNTMIGRSAGYAPNGVTANANVTGAYNTYIGYQSGASTTSQLSASIAIGKNAIVGASNVAIIGGTGATDYVTLAVPRGQAASVYATVGGTITDYFTDTTVGGAEADIYTKTLEASVLATNGDKIVASYGGNFVTVGTELTQLKVYFGGTAIWDSTGVAPTTGTTSWRVSVEIIRVSSTVVRYEVALNTTGASGFVYCTVGELTGLTLSNTNIIKITGTSTGVGSGSGDIIGKIGYIKFNPHGI